MGKLLSKPRIVTQNNEKAMVQQGVKIPIQTTINNTISVQFIDATLKLEVTPQITAEGTIFMDVLVENTQIDPGIPRVQGIPALDRSRRHRPKCWLRTVGQWSSAESSCRRRIKTSQKFPLSAACR